MKDRTKQILDFFFSRHTDLEFMRENILHACRIILNAYNKGGKVLICGNGGSSADSEHIVGEFMKGFLLRRPLDSSMKDKFELCFGEDGRDAADKLQCSLPAISLSAHTALSTAFNNDVDSSLTYAQQVIGYGEKEDVIIGISTSGNAQNVYYAFMTGKVKGMQCIALSGRDGGKLASIADCNLIAPVNETFLIQEYHIAIYHFICSYVESEMFEK